MQGEPLDSLYVLINGTVSSSSSSSSSSSVIIIIIIRLLVCPRPHNVRPPTLTRRIVPRTPQLEVRVAGRIATTLQPYQLIGEASLLENLQSDDGTLNPPARATVVAAPGASYARWPQRALWTLQVGSDPA